MNRVWISGAMVLTVAGAVLVANAQGRIGGPSRLENDAGVTDATASGDAIASEAGTPAHDLEIKDEEFGLSVDDLEQSTATAEIAGPPPPPPNSAADAREDEAPTDVCDPRRVMPVDADGHCCRPGERWSGRACEGALTSCMPGMRLQSDTNARCVPIDCESGRVRVGDGCCWPGQTWSTEKSSCEGAAKCPEGVVATANGCTDGPRLLATQPPVRAARDAMVWIGGGAFAMGPTPSTRWVFVNGFWMDRTEVTAAQYGQCVRAGVCRAVSDPFRLGRDGNVPVVNVTFAMASTYCNFRRARLPTEAEWELAARGVDGRTFPWGERVPDCSLANVQGCVETLARVNSHVRGASPLGILDMAGNVAEWTLDRAGAVTTVSVNPVSFDESPRRIVRGGSFESPLSAVKTTSRMARHESEARYDIGFRCVRTL